MTRSMTSTTSAPTAARPRPTDQPRLRVLAGGGGARQLTLPYEYEVAPGVPAVPTIPSHLRLVPDSPAEPRDLVPAGLEPPGRWTHRLARAIAEVAAGERQPGQLTGLVSREVQTYLALRGRAVARHPSSRSTRGSSRMVGIRGVRVCPVAPGIVETSAVLVGPDRSRAVAIRLEAQGDRWIATAVTLG